MKCKGFCHFCHFWAVLRGWDFCFGLAGKEVQVHYAGRQAALVGLGLQRADYVVGVGRIYVLGCLVWRGFGGWSFGGSFGLSGDLGN